MANVTSGSLEAVEAILKDQKLFREAAYIDGNWIRKSANGATKVDNPATGAVIGEVPNLGAAETRQAIDAAARALGPWQRETAKARANILRRWFDLMMENQEDLARLLTLEQGKPLSEARGEITNGAAFLEWFGEEAKRIYGDVIPPHQADKRIVVLKQPIGVVGCITPWNFPSAMITRKVAPAIAAGSR
ncbi:MAG TPA: aldehyde dehydrogenase family protein [Candidatus Acidoferrales bacterium]|jgi:succinate-semialdehyde dehydrogenase/glutarate-semialdehyde dehydrogenase|nr:aldehyde dehydrogenase family protein [Candidatus Acidoferrales bacterium]